MDIDSEFYIEEELSTSGFNRLLVARSDGRYYMLKGLKAACQGEFVYRELLHKEFEMPMQLDHPNIIRTEGLIDIAGVGPCIIREYVKGVSQGDYLQRKTTLRSWCRIADRLIDALAYIHKLQIVYRDLKPDILLVTFNGDNPKG